MKDDADRRPDDRHVQSSWSAVGGQRSAATMNDETMRRIFVAGETILTPEISGTTQVSQKG